MTAYYIDMDDGRRLRIEAISAAQAVCTALEEHLTHRVSSCWSGSPSKEADVGFIEYDIPRHEPLNEAPPQTAQAAYGSHDAYVSGYSGREGRGSA